MRHQKVVEKAEEERQQMKRVEKKRVKNRAVKDSRGASPNHM